MLKFKESALDWADIASVSHSASGQVSITTTDAQVIEVGQYDDQNQAFAVYTLIESARAAFAAGGIIIEVIIDDL